MATLPHDVVDLYLAPVAITLDGQLEDLSHMTVHELDVHVGVRTDHDPLDVAGRRAGLLKAFTHVTDMHGWTLAWGDRGLLISHAEHRLTLGLPQNLRNYLDVGAGGREDEAT